MVPAARRSFVRRFAPRVIASIVLTLASCVSTSAPSPTSSLQSRPDGGSTCGAPVAPAPALEPSTCGAPPANVEAPPYADTPTTGPYLWRNVAIVAGGFVTGIVFSPAQKDVVYARTDIGGAYRWDAASGRWVPLLDWIGRSQSNWAGVESIAADPHDGKTVYVAAGTYVTSGNGAILSSHDQGRSFNVVSTQIPMGSNNDGRSVGERLAVDPNDSNTLYFGSRRSGLWKSTDGAATWNRVTTFPGPSTTPNTVGIPFVVFDPRSCGPGGQTTVYAAVAEPGTSLYRSDDGGATWTAVPNQPTTLLPNRAAISATGVMYVTYGGGKPPADGGAPSPTLGDGPNNVSAGAVYRLDVRTGQWTDVSPVPQASFGFAGVSVDAEHPQTVVVSTLDHWGLDDIYRSTDGGDHWIAVGVPTAQHDLSAAPWVNFHQSNPNFTGWMGDVEIDPFNSSRVLHVTGQGIWASDDITAVDSACGGATIWTFRSVGIEETAVTDLASPPSGPPLLSAVGDIGGFRHDDLSVSPAGGMSDNPVFTTTDSIDFAELAPLVVARVGRGSNAGSPHGALSTDGGSTWAPFKTSLPASNNSAGTIAVAADGSALVWYAPPIPATMTSPAVPGGPQVSHDSGATWTPSAGIGAVPVIADRVNPMAFYGYDPSAGRVLVSADQAATFTPGATGLPKGNGRLRATPGVAGDLWLTASGTLLHSTDGGATFTAVAGPSNVFAFGLGMAPPTSTYPALFVGGTVGGHTGIFRSDDVGATFTAIDDTQHQFATATVIVGDPRVYGRVYVGNNGRGILYGEPAP
ncbi:MAG TPA: xyloglucanase [Polyangiaceae bacterium]|nr:xyloglucanase [Polyangiaceae bacterium]